MERVNYPLDLEYARIMEKNFDKPMINQLTIVNNVDGIKDIKKQINLLLRNIKE
jgi:hypothetical protein